MYACMARIYVHCISENLRSSFLCAFVHAKRTFESVCTYKQPVVVVILCGSLSLSHKPFHVVCWWRASSARYTKFYKEKDELRQEILWIQGQKPRKRERDRMSEAPLSVLLLYLFDINEMVKSSVKNSINLFWLTSKLFLTFGSIISAFSIEFICEMRRRRSMD